MLRKEVMLGASFTGQYARVASVGTIRGGKPAAIHCFTANIIPNQTLSFNSEFDLENKAYQNTSRELFAPQWPDWAVPTLFGHTGVQYSVKKITSPNDFEGNVYPRYPDAYVHGISHNTLSFIYSTS